ncbi:uracil-xanthine permease family protein [Synergistes jonesii]|mgnify:FL=1|uniref:uracil-xanthine permease family protein n=1 Tax=Synergistes jonesii TaxID=2754 RepID=UPI00248E149D|nr:solute carrier family 23 protein [Synergistes jonesii]
MAKKKLVYGIDDRPPLPIMILAGAQHVLTLFGATTLVPLVLGPAMGMTTAQIGAFIGCVYFSMGIATLFQTHPKIGSGLPIVQGSSFSFIPPIMTIIGAYKAMGPDVVMQYVGGALIAGGVVLSLLGYSRLIGRVRRIITPVVIGPTIMAIGFSLAPTAIQYNAANFWPVSLLVVLLVFFFSLVSKNKYFNIFAILSSVVIAYLLCLLLSLSGVFAPGHAAYIDLQSVYAAPWFRYKLFMPWGAPKLSGLAIGAIAAGFFCVMIESIGDYHNCSYAAGIDDPTPAQINRGIGVEGAMCALSGLLGSVATTSYTENIGLIGLTGVASRYVVRAGAVILILLSLIGKLGALIATMPTPVIGGAYITLFGTIGALGIQNLMRADMGSQRNVLIVGFAFLMALGLPGWVEPNQALFAGALGTTFGGMIWAVLKTPMAVAGILAALCDNLVPGTPEERGIAGGSK